MGSDVIVKMSVNSDDHDAVKQISDKECRSIQDTYRMIIRDWLSHIYNKKLMEGTVECPYCKKIWRFKYPDKYVLGRWLALEVDCESMCSKLRESELDFPHTFTVYLDDKGVIVPEKSLFNRKNVFFMVEKSVGHLINVEWKKVYREHEGKDTTPLKEKNKGSGIFKPFCINPNLTTCWGYKPDLNGLCINKDLSGVCTKAE